MKFLNKTGLALKLSAVGLLSGLQGCSMTVDEAVAKGTAEAFAAMLVYGSEEFGRLPPCAYPSGFTIADFPDVAGTENLGAACERTTLLTQSGGKIVQEVNANGMPHGLSHFYQDGRLEEVVCKNSGNVVASKSRSVNNQDFFKVTSSCDHIRGVVTEDTATLNRLDACDSFGFERGTQAHAECAMKLFMNEQNQGTAKAVTSSNNQQTAALARQQAIQEATLKEQKRIQELEASLRMMQFGIDLMNGTTSSPTPSKTHSQTQKINGQIIRCTTTGSITTCL